MVLYLKYRPQKLAELDITSVRDKLVGTLASSYRPHAYLFSGPKGTGKTSAARIIAKALNCLNPKEQALTGSTKKYNEPCNKCENCREILSGRHMDIIEIDAASNRGIDEIRDLKEKIRLAQVSAEFKVYIIDEVHMLTNEAFNALLKTLEEPPAHAVFILATTEPDKLPETILSRCVVFRFHKANIDEVIHSLKRVVGGEKLKIDDEIMSLIARHADGSFRDATKILEQVIGENKITLQDVSYLLGKGIITPENFLILLGKKDINQLLQSISLMGERGSDFRLFVTTILNVLHVILLDLHKVKQSDLSADIRKIYAGNGVIQAIRMFSRVYTDLKFASRPELPLETAVVEWCEGKDIK